MRLHWSLVPQVFHSAPFKNGGDVSLFPVARGFRLSAVIF